MVEGTVIGCIRRIRGVSTLNIRGKGVHSGKTTCINVRDKHLVLLGDEISWRTDQAFWTFIRDDGSAATNRPLAKIGVAHSKGFFTGDQP